MSSSMPTTLAVRDNESVVDVDYDPFYSLPMLAWREYWRENRDFDLSPWPKSNHILNERAGFNGLTYTQVMPVGVEHIETVLSQLPYRVRLAAWCWWVEGGCLSQRATADAVKHKLRTRELGAVYNRGLFATDISMVVGVVAGRVSLLDSLGDIGDEDNGNWWIVE